MQVWAPESSLPVSDCGQGLATLIDGIGAARRASTTPGQEESALREFRKAIAPYWAIRPALGPLCAKDPHFAGKLEEVDRLRYAEEHAVRYFARDLSEGRRAIASLRTRLREAPPLSDRTRTTP